MSDPLDGVPAHLRPFVHANQYGDWARRRNSPQEKERFLAQHQAEYDAAQKSNADSPKKPQAPHHGEQLRRERGDLRRDELEAFATGENPWSKPIQAVSPLAADEASKPREPQLSVGESMQKPHERELVVEDDISAGMQDGIVFPGPSTETETKLSRSI